MGTNRKPLLQRFKEKYKEDQQTGCWVWFAGTNGAGYGLIRPGGLSPRMLAHRASWELFKGPIPEHSSYHGICVLHRCDNRACVNPDHLFLGTNEDNIHDCMAKNRKPTKLTLAQVIAIKARSSCGEPTSKLAREYGVERSTVKRIKRGASWKHMEVSHF